VLTIAMADPTNVFAMDDIKFMTGYNVEAGGGVRERRSRTRSSAITAPPDRSKLRRDSAASGGAATAMATARRAAASLKEALDRTPAEASRHGLDRGLSRDVRP
jgi:hypothetical protein